MHFIYFATTSGMRELRLWKSNNSNFSDYCRYLCAVCSECFKIAIYITHAYHLFGTTSGMRKWQLSKYRILNFSETLSENYVQVALIGSGVSIIHACHIFATTSGMREWQLPEYKILNFSKTIADNYAQFVPKVRENKPSSFFAKRIFAINSGLRKRHHWTFRTGISLRLLHIMMRSLR